MLLFDARSRMNYLRFKFFGNLYKLELYSVWKNILASFFLFLSLGTGWTLQAILSQCRGISYEKHPWHGWVHPNIKYGILACWRNLRNDLCRKNLWPSSEADHKPVIWDVSSLNLEGKSILISEDKGYREESEWTDLAKSSLVYYAWHTHFVLSHFFMTFHISSTLS